MKKLLALMIFVALVFPVQARMYIGDFKTLQFTASASPMDGTSPTHTYSQADAVASHIIFLSDRADEVEIIGFSTASTGGTEGNDHVQNGLNAVFSIFGYSKNGPAISIASRASFTIGIASVGTDVSSGTYANNIQSGGVNYIDAEDSLSSIVNGIGSLEINIPGLKFLVFDPVQFSGLSNFTIQVREFGTLK